MGTSPFHLLLLLGYCLAVIEGELRCHCNESGCVSTGYMCKSQAGQCFTALEARGDGTHRTHGCLESLPEHHRALCQPTDSDTDSDTDGQGAEVRAVRSTSDDKSSGSSLMSGASDGQDSLSGDADGGNGASSSSSEPRHQHHHRQQLQQQQQQQQTKQVVPILLCCTKHMCNFREEADITVNLIPKLNSTFHRGSASSIAENSVFARDHHSARRHDDDADRDLWFKAAVIAVPIAGGFILVLLVLLAVRMLRTDSTRHRRLIQIRRERSLTKAHMYISDHFMGRSPAVANKLQHCSLFDEELYTARGRYSASSEKPQSDSGGRGAPGSGGGNGNVYSSSGSGGNSSKGSGNSSNSGFSSGFCSETSCCCRDVCVVHRETELNRPEPCSSNVRLSGCNVCCSKCNCLGPPEFPTSTVGDIKNTNPPCSKIGGGGGEGKSNHFSPSPSLTTATPSQHAASSFIPNSFKETTNNIYHKPCSFPPDPPSAYRCSSRDTNSVRLDRQGCLPSPQLLTRQDQTLGDNSVCSRTCSCHLASVHHPHLPTHLHQEQGLHLRQDQMMRQHVQRQTPPHQNLQQPPRRQQQQQQQPVHQHHHQQHQQQQPHQHQQQGVHQHVQRQSPPQRPLVATWGKANPRGPTASV